jgi:hypothetical protein
MITFQINKRPIFYMLKLNKYLEILSARVHKDYATIP